MDYYREAACEQSDQRECISKLCISPSKGPVWIMCGIMLQRDVLMKRVVMWWGRRANYGVAE